MKQTKGISAVKTMKGESLQAIHTLSNNHKTGEVLIGKTNSKIQALIDTGAEVNILLESMVPPSIRRIFPTPVTLQPYGSSLIKPKGQITLDTTWHNKTMRATWVIIDDKDLCGKPCNLVSFALAESLGILSFNNPPHEVNSVLNSTIHNSQTSKNFYNLLNSTHPSVANRGGSSTFSDILKGSKYKTTPKDHTQTIIIVLIIMPERSRTIEISKAFYLQNQN